MASDMQQTKLSPEIRAVLRTLRWRTRAYVWVEGLALAGIWLALTFWIGLAIDYLPVLAGSSEMPAGARLVLLLVIAAVLALILYRWIFRRTFVRLADHSMAVLLERQFNQFHDSLLTAVEMSERPDHATSFSGPMLAHTSRQARAQIGKVRLGKLFNFAPLWRSVLLSLVMVFSVVLFGVFATDSFAIWVNRLYRLSPDPWPRMARIELVGFKEGGVKVARGSSLAVKVRADSHRKVPEVCTIHYRTEEGDRGRVNMRRVGEPRDGWQNYVFDGKPFEAILASIRFDVVGYDHRLRDRRVLVVDSPTVIETQLECTFPDYLVDRELSLYLPRTVDWIPGKLLERGTAVTVIARTNKDLAEARIRDPLTGKTHRHIPDGSDELRTFRYTIDSLDCDTVLEVTLVDTDGVTGERPHLITVGLVEDTEPSVEGVLSGIGDAVTPVARLPAVGQVTDDHAVAKTWLELEVVGTGGREYPLNLSAGGKLDDVLDLRDERDREQNPLAIKPGDKLVVSVKAADKFELNDGPNVGSSDRYPLDVVTTDALLAILEGRELRLGVRFKQVVDEMTDTRDSLIRIRFDEPTGGENRVAQEPGKNARPSDEGPDAQLSEDQRAMALRHLRVQRAIQDSQRNSQEALGVATSFDDIRLELINNRVNSPREKRLKEGIVDPLNRVVQTMFPELERRLAVLEGHLDDPRSGQVAVIRAVEQADTILEEMRKIQQEMLESQSYNELINIVRTLIEQQDRLIEETDEQRKKQAKDDLGNLLE